jgi:signal transduction histidine kinase
MGAGMAEKNQETSTDKAATIGMVQTPQTKQKLSVGLVISLVLGSALISIFYATSTYKTQTEHVVELADGRSKQFEVVFTELKQARFRAMGIGADTLLRSRVTIDPFIKRDRAALAAQIDPFFAFLKEKHGVNQLNFWIPPATMFYRAGAPELGQFDGSKFRASVVAANARQERIMAVETGQGGVIGIRGIVPVIWDDKFYGLVEFVSDFSLPLNGASVESHFQWATSITKERFAQVERARNEKEDAEKGEDIYINYSDPATRDIIKAIDFDPRSKDYKIVDNNGQKIFVKAFPIYNFVGQPTITIAMVDDLTDQFNAAFKSAVIKGGILFLLLAAALVAAYSKLDDLRTGMLGSIGAERRALKDRLARGDAAIEKLKDLETLKRRYFSNLMAAINSPLLAVSGQISGIKHALEAGSASNKGDIDNRVDFSIQEIDSLRHLVADYEQVELFRQTLVRAEAKPLSVPAVLEDVLKSLDLSRRLPNLQVNIDVPDDMPSTYGDSRLLAGAISRLITHTTHASGSGLLNISLRSNGEDSLILNFSGSAYAGSLAPTAALLDEARQFMAELSTGFISDGKREKLIGIILAKAVIEHFGGTLEAGSADAPGFLVRFPTAA